MLVAMADGPAMFEHILVPLDGSCYAEMALAHARNLAHLTGARVTLLTVAMHHLISMPHVQRLDEESRRLALDYLKPIQQRLESSGVNADVQVVIGDPAQAIVDVAKQEKVDVIIMSSRGVGMKGAYVLGSVALGVLQTASCPVLILRITERSQPAQSH